MTDSYRTAAECREALERLVSDTERTSQYTRNYLWGLEQRIAELETDVKWRDEKQALTNNALTQAETKLEAIESLLYRIIENRVDDVGECDGDSRVCGCTECLARAALAWQPGTIVEESP